MLSFRKIHESLTNPGVMQKHMQETPNFSDPGYPVIGTRMGNTDKSMSQLTAPIQRPHAGEMPIEYPQQNQNIFEELQRRADAIKHENQERKMSESEEAEEALDVQFVKSIIMSRPDIIIQALLAQMATGQ